MYIEKHASCYETNCLEKNQNLKNEKTRNKENVLLTEISNQQSYPINYVKPSRVQKTKKLINWVKAKKQIKNLEVEFNYIKTN